MAPPRTRSSDKRNDKKDVQQEGPNNTTIEGQVNTTVVLQEQFTPAKMKVIDLREALTARGLSPKGLKKDLIDRLGAALRRGVAESTPLRHAIKSENEDPEYSSRQDSKASSPTKRIKVDDFNESNTSVEGSASLVPPVVPPPIPSPTSPQNASKLQIEDKELSADHSKVEPDTISVPTPQINESPAHSATNYPVTSTNVLPLVVHITNFVRPFTIPSVKELVGQFGAVIEFWMDSLKSQCYVQYETLQAAEDCIRKLNGLRWPLEAGRTLNATKSTMHALQQAQHSETQPKSLPFDEAPLVLDTLFMKTEASPHLYYLPVHPPH